MDETFSWLGPEPIAYKFYNGTRTLFFDQKPHKYFRFDDDDNQLYIPGVSTVVGIVDKSAPLMQWSANKAVEYIAKQLDAGSTVIDGNPDELSVRKWLESARFAHKEIKEDAGEVGHIAHDYIEQWIKAQIRGDHDGASIILANPPAEQRSANGASAAFDWMQAHKVKWLYTERLVYSAKYDFAGTLDGMALISSCGDPECCGEWIKTGGRWELVALQFTDALTLVDWKTSNHLAKSYDWQTAGYLIAAEEEFGCSSPYPELNDFIKYRVIIRLGKEDAQFEARFLPPSTLAANIKTFLSCLENYRNVSAEEDEDKLRRREVRQQAKSDKEEEEARVKAENAAKRERLKKIREFKDTRYRELRAQKVPVIQAKQQVEEEVASWAA